METDNEVQCRLRRVAVSTGNAENVIWYNLQPDKLPLPDQCRQCVLLALKKQHIIDRLADLGVATDNNGMPIAHQVGLQDKNGQFRNIIVDVPIAASSVDKKSYLRKGLPFNCPYPKASIVLGPETVPIVATIITDEEEKPIL